MQEKGPIATGDVVATYPSGQKIHQPRGALYIGMVDGELFIAIVPQNQKRPVFIIDQRAVITVNEKIEYHPRVWFVYLNAEMKQWLADHPAWASVACITDEEADGAWPNGTRIKKTCFENGDTHQVGDTGTVRGSVLLDDGRYAYSIHWDDQPSIPVHCLAYKIEPILA
jgi:hypothetical protein